jgi:hypothetical protein
MKKLEYKIPISQVPGGHNSGNNLARVFNLLKVVK